MVRKIQESYKITQQYCDNIKNCLQQNKGKYLKLTFQKIKVVIPTLLNLIKHHLQRRFWDSKAEWCRKWQRKDEEDR